MAKKKLLSEKQVRRFMGLAGIQPLNEMGDHSYKRDEEMEEGQRGKPNEEMEEGQRGKHDEEPMKEEMEDEPKELEGPVDSDLDEKEELAKDVISAVADALGLEIDIDMEDDMGEEEPMDDMPEMDEEEPMDDMEDEDMDDEELMKEMSDVSVQLSEEEIVNEVARRVAKRIVEAKRAHKKMNEALGKRRRK